MCVCVRVQVKWLNRNGIWTMVNNGAEVDSIRSCGHIKIQMMQSKNWALHCHTKCVLRKFTAENVSVGINTNIYMLNSSSLIEVAEPKRRMCSIVGWADLGWFVCCDLAFVPMLSSEHVMCLSWRIYLVASILWLLWYFSRPLLSPSQKPWRRERKKQQHTSNRKTKGKRTEADI